MSNHETSYDFRLQAQPAAFFETPVALGKLKEGDKFLDDLESVILKRMEQDEGISRSNMGSWHSDSRMLEWGGAAAKKLAETAIALAQRMSHFKDGAVDQYQWMVEMWANVTPQGGSNHIHVHPGNLWAAVLYIDMGNDGKHDSDVGGEFYLEDPRFPMHLMRNANFRLRDVAGKPQEVQPRLKLERGNLLMFPAWLRHGVLPYHGISRRISIALNIDAVPLEIKSIPRT